MTRTDLFIQGDVMAYLNQHGLDSSLAIWRFADDSDGSQYMFGHVVRFVKSPQEAVSASRKSRYMGRKKHIWYVVQ
jgi:hypothetical protein